MRLLLFDTTAYQPSTPLFVEAAADLAQSRVEEFRYELCDEARFIKVSASGAGGTRKTDRLP